MQSFPWRMSNLLFTRGAPQLDTKAEAVLLPIYGVLVPFHITTIRNVTTTNDAGGDAALVSLCGKGMFCGRVALVSPIQDITVEAEFTLPLGL